MMTPALRRQQENAELLRRMKSGDNLCHTDLSAFRWAPRQQIKKDPKEQARLYGPPLGIAKEDEAHGN